MGERNDSARRFLKTHMQVWHDAEAFGDDAKVLGAPQSIRDDFAAKASYGD
jgi:hypothetical protein